MSNAALETPSVVPGHRRAYAHPSPVIQRQPDDPSVSWVPDRYVDVGGCEVGIAWDDGCLVVLVEKAPGQWLPTSWIPPQAVDAMREMVSAYPLQVGE